MSFGKIFSSFIFLIFQVVFLSILSKSGAIARQQSTSNNQTLYYKVIPSLDNTWGYDIYLDGKIIIHQPSIPALTGNKGFETKGQAIKVAKAIVIKIRQGQMPPTITIEELKKLNAI